MKMKRYLSTCNFQSADHKPANRHSYYHPHSKEIGMVMFSLASVHPHLQGSTPILPDWRGTPILPDGGTLFPGLDGGVPPSEVKMGGTPIQDQDGEYPHPRSGQGYPGTCDGSIPCPDQGAGTPIQTWDGIPPCPNLG